MPLALVRNPNARRYILRLRPDVPVALISGFVTDDLAARAEALGVKAVIFKPNLTRDLAPLIGRLLSAN